MLFHFFIDMITFQTSAYDTEWSCLFVNYNVFKILDVFPRLSEKKIIFLKSHVENLERENLKFFISLESFGHLNWILVPWSFNHSYCLLCLFSTVFSLTTFFV